MCRVDCVVYRGCKDVVLSRLHRLGVVQVDFLTSEELEAVGLGRDRPLDLAAEVSSLLQRVRAVKDALFPYRVGESTFLDDVFGVERVKPQQVLDVGFQVLRAEVVSAV